MAAFAGILLVNCGLLAGIDDFKSVDDAGSVVGTDASIVGETDSVFDVSSPDIAAPIDGAIVDEAVVDASCEGAQQGAPIGGDPLFRCCGGKATRVDTNENCGVCGFACKTDAGVSCQGRDGHLFCAGCAASGNGGFSLVCNLGCCDKGVYADGVCAPNVLCLPNTCLPGICGTYGATCSPLDAAVAYCTYE
jgi:hypothetical protein